MKIIPRTRIEIGSEEFKAALDCIISNQVIKGQNINRFETKLEEYLDIELVKTVKSGRSALFQWNPDCLQGGTLPEYHGMLEQGHGNISYYG